MGHSVPVVVPLELASPCARQFAAIPQGRVIRRGGLWRLLHTVDVRAQPKTSVSMISILHRRHGVRVHIHEMVHVLAGTHSVHATASGEYVILLPGPVIFIFILAIRTGS